MKTAYLRITTILFIIFFMNLFFEKMNSDLLIELLNECKFEDLKEKYFNQTIEKIPYEMKAKFLLKRRQLLYA